MREFYGIWTFASLPDPHDHFHSFNPISISLRLNSFLNMHGRELHTVNWTLSLSLSLSVIFGVISSEWFLHNPTSRVSVIPRPYRYIHTHLSICLGAYPSVCTYYITTVETIITHSIYYRQYMLYPVV